MNIELDGDDDGVLDIWVALVIAYMQTCEILIRLIPMKCDQVVHNTKKFLWEVNFLLWVWSHGQMQVVPNSKQCESLVWHVQKKLTIGPF